MLRISVSQLALFKQCPRKWFLRYAAKHVKETVPGDALRIGDAIHHGIEAFYAGKPNHEIFSVVSDKARAASFSFDDGGIVSASTGESEAASVALMQAYILYENQRTDHRIEMTEPERGFPETPEEEKLLLLGYVDYTPIVLGGRWDGYGEPGGEPCIYEHKTVSNLGSVTEADLYVDEQVSAMLWAASRLKRRPVTSCVYNLLCKPTLKYRSRGNENENPQRYARRVADHILREPSKFFERFSVKRHPDQLQQWQEDAMLVAQQMVRGPWWPALKGSWNGPCRFCEFLGACTVWSNEEARNNALRGIG